MDLLIFLQREDFFCSGKGESGRSRSKVYSATWYLGGGPSAVTTVAARWLAVARRRLAGVAAAGVEAAVSLRLPLPAAATIRLPEPPLLPPLPPCPSPSSEDTPPLLHTRRRLPPRLREALARSADTRGAVPKRPPSVFLLDTEPLGSGSVCNTKMKKTEDKDKAYRASAFATHRREILARQRGGTRLEEYLSVVLTLHVMIACRSSNFTTHCTQQVATCT